MKDFEIRRTTRGQPKSKITSFEQRQAAILEYLRTGRAATCSNPPIFIWGGGTTGGGDDPYYFIQPDGSGEAGSGTDPVVGSSWPSCLVDQTMYWTWAAIAVGLPDPYMSLGLLETRVLLDGVVVYTGSGLIDEDYIEIAAGFVVEAADNGKTYEMQIKLDDNFITVLKALGISTSPLYSWHTLYTNTINICGVGGLDVIRFVDQHPGGDMLEVLADGSPVSGHTLFMSHEVTANNGYIASGWDPRTIEVTQNFQHVQPFAGGYTILPGTDGARWEVETAPGVWGSTVPEVDQAQRFSPREVASPGVENLYSTQFDFTPVAGGDAYKLFGYTYWHRPTLVKTNQNVGIILSIFDGERHLTVGTYDSLGVWIEARVCFFRNDNIHYTGNFDGVDAKLNTFNIRQAPNASPTSERVNGQANTLWLGRDAEVVILRDNITGDVFYEFNIYQLNTLIARINGQCNVGAGGKFNKYPDFVRSI
jgi:hypothetical protein